MTRQAVSWRRGILPASMPWHPAAAVGTAPGRSSGAAGGFVRALLLLFAGAAAAHAQIIPVHDRIDLTGQQNLTLGAGARAYGMGGAFIARADDATAASWNPAGLSYLRTPEVSFAANHNSFREKGFETDTLEGQSFDFAAFTWPVAIGQTRGSIQLSYQRAVGFDGTRTIDAGGGRRTEGRGDGGLDVLAFGTGLRPTRRLRLGITVNRWLNGYGQSLVRTVPDNLRTLREFETDFRPRGWSFNLGVIWSPVEDLNIGGVFKTPFGADVTLSKTRTDFWASDSSFESETFNAATSEDVRIDFPASVGFGISWRVRDTLTVSADFTQSRWSTASIYDFFVLPPTPRRDDPSQTPSPPDPVVYEELPYPTLVSEQVDAQQIRAGVEWVVISSPRLKIPLRAGYFNDRQITAYPDGRVPRYNGVTVGTGLVLGSVLLDVAYLLEFGSDTVPVEVEPGDASRASTIVPVEFSLRTQRVFASLIYRFGRRP